MLKSEGSEKENRKTHVINSKNQRNNITTDSTVIKKLMSTVNSGMPTNMTIWNKWINFLKETNHQINLKKKQTF